MNKTEQATVAALLNGRTVCQGNSATGPAYNADSVEPKRIGTSYALHGHTIAILHHGPKRLFITDAGWQTMTTKSRLNAILSATAPGYAIVQRDHVWYLVEPDGSKTAWTGSAKFNLDATI